MGTRITVVGSGRQFEPLDITQVEDVFTKNVADTTGGLPMISVTLPRTIHFFDIVGQALKIESSTLGETSGVVTEITVDNTGATVCLLNTKLNPLVRLAKAKPFVGTVADLIRYYFRLGGITSGYEINSKYEGIRVNAQGWQDVIWNRMTKLQSIYEFEVALVSDRIVVRPWRVRTADVGHIQETGYQYSLAEVSRTIELDYFSNRKISNELVYPVRGVKDDSTTLTANAREQVEVELELSSSLSSILPPRYQETISRNHRGPGSVYCVTDKDGYVLKASEWSKYGGRLSVQIGPDSKTLIVKLTGPNISRKEPFTVSYAPIENMVESNGAMKRRPNRDNAFNSLFVIGSGVGYTQRTVSLVTGARPQDVVQDVGFTASEPEISTLSQLYNAAVPILNEASGGRLIMTGTIARINQRGTTGAATGLPVGDVENLNAGRTYGIMEDDIHSGMTVRQVEDFYNASMLFDFDNQAFGNSAGARIFDPDTDRWFRITSATITFSGVQFTAEDDLTYGDVEDWLDNATVGYVEDSLWPGITYWDLEKRGLR